MFRREPLPSSASAQGDAGGRRRRRSRPPEAQTETSERSQQIAPSIRQRGPGQAWSFRCQLPHNQLQSLRGSRARSSLAHFKRNELDHEVLELPWQLLAHGRQVSDGQLTTDSAQCVIHKHCHGVSSLRFSIANHWLLGPTANIRIEIKASIPPRLPGTLSFLKRHAIRV